LDRIRPASARGSLLPDLKSWTATPIGSFLGIETTKQGPMRTDSIHRTGKMRSEESEAGGSARPGFFFLIFLWFPQTLTESSNNLPAIKRQTHNQKFGFRQDRVSLSPN
jgi:hypothetical protein